MEEDNMEVMLTTSRNGDDDDEDEEEEIDRVISIRKPRDRGNRKISLTRRNATATEYRSLKIDDNKLLEANRKRAVLFQHLSQINREKKIMFEKNEQPENNHRIKTHKKQEDIIKKKESRRGKRLLQIKKKKKEEKKKQKKQKLNFLTANNYLKQMSYENYDINHIKEIRNWSSFLKEKIMIIFPSYALNIDYLIKHFEMLFIDEAKASKYKEEDELDKLRFYNGAEIKTAEKKKQQEDYDENDNKKENDQKKKTLEEQKKLLEELLQKEAEFQKSKNSTGLFLSNMKEYKDALREKNYQMMEQDPIAENNNNTDDDYDDLSDGEREAQRERMILEAKEAEKLKERVINYTLKTFDKFSLQRIIMYWMDNCDKLKDKKVKDLHYKNKTNDPKGEVEEKERKKQQKTINVKHIYSTPTQDVLHIIPFCSKKYTIQKKDG